MKSPQLKPTLVPIPCPFCGKKPSVGPHHKCGNMGNAWGYVGCFNKRCAVRPYCEDGQNVADDRGTGAYIDCAIARWNKRKVAS